ncbi:MAG: hydroxyacid dehydrogenase [Anaerolineales bacterium]|nr:hydroxyacid dehydrogenase [Anaerolineales bacterium]
MSNYKVIITDGLEKVGISALEKAGIEVANLNGISPEELVSVIGDYDGLIVRSRTKVTRELLEAASNLKVVGRAGVGVDNIDLAAAQSAGVTVVNSPMATTTAVAEHTLALMLSLARKISRADSDMKRGLWSKKELKGSELNGKTLGIIGMGRIGCNVSMLAQAFGMRTLGFDPLIPAEKIQENCTEPATFDELITQSDFITLHIPLTDETRNILNGAVFSRMKPGVYLICDARGGVVDETALLANLESGQVAGAALDVFSKEPPGLTALVSHPNVVATPHIAAQTDEAQERAAAHIASEIIAALNQEELRWKIV